jgi:hypothetical protein
MNFITLTETDLRDRLDDADIRCVSLTAHEDGTWTLEHAYRGDGTLLQGWLEGRLREMAHLLILDSRDDQNGDIPRITIRIGFLAAFEHGDRVRVNHRVPGWWRGLYRRTGEVRAVQRGNPHGYKVRFEGLDHEFWLDHTWLDAAD